MLAAGAIELKIGMARRSKAMRVERGWEWISLKYQGNPLWQAQTQMEFPATRVLQEPVAVQDCFHSVLAHQSAR